MFATFSPSDPTVSILVGLVLFFGRGENFGFVSTCKDSVLSLFLTEVSELSFELTI